MLNSVKLNILPVDSRRFKFLQTEWVPVGRAEYIHRERLLDGEADHIQACQANQCASIELNFCKNPLLGTL